MVLILKQPMKKYVEKNDKASNKKAMKKKKNANQCHPV